MKIFTIEEKDKPIVARLESLGYVWGEYVNVWETGQTAMMKKKVGDVFLWFEWHWDNQGGPEFYTGLLRGHFNYDPSDNFLHPVMFIDVTNILHEYMEKLPFFEQQILAAINIQKRY